MLLKLISIVLGTLLLPRIIVGQIQSQPPSRAAAQAPTSGGQQARTEETNVPASETPPDERAFREAWRILDPGKRIEALQKFKRDFPRSALVETTDMRILSTLATTMPDQTSQIREQAKLMYRTAGKDAKGRTAGAIANVLLDASVLLKEAERYAQMSVDSFSQERYIKEQLAGARVRKGEPPKREELVKRFRESRAAPVATLGRIEVALGNDKRGKQLLEEARQELPANAAVAGALGELAAKQGETAVAMDYLLTARLGGRIAPSTIAALESVYRQTHNGSLDGLESMLNQEYRRRFPNPLKLEDYTPTEKRSSRVVLGEIFTGAGCPPCVAADLAFDAAMERYDRKELAVLAYHVHVPRPDPMTNLDTRARFAAYEAFSTPTFAIDGKITRGGGVRERTKEVYDGAKGFSQDIEKDLELPAEASISLKTSISQGVVKASAAVDKVDSESRDLKLQIALVEEEVEYGGENGIRFHSMVVRAMGGPKAGGFPLDPGQPTSFDEAFDIAKVSTALKAHLDDYEAKGHRGEPFKFLEKKYQIDPAHLAVVAFVQDVKTKHVLQATYVDVPGSAPRPVVEP